MYPDLFWLQQRFDGPRVDDPARRTADALASLSLGDRVRPGQSVAVGVGSRGIANLSTIVRATIDHLTGLGLEPFIVPAMGSHGGGDVPGQTAVLDGYGVTEDAMGCPIRAQMETIELGTTALGFPIHFDRLAAGADHVVIVNRIKPHTMFTGDVESGLAKMLLIGLGKQPGAETYHRAILDHEWPTIVSTVSPAILSKVSVLAGIAIVENSDDETARIEAIAGESIVSDEPALLAQAKELMPRLPFADLDILLIDEIGKNISGGGFDPNVVGRKDSLHEPDRAQPVRVRAIVVRALTEATHGNALGIGFAELCRTRVVDEMDRSKTWLNAITASDLPAGMIPIHYDTDRELLDACETRTGLRGLPNARLCWIRNTLDLGVVACSVAYLDEARERPDLTVLSKPTAMPLDAMGNLPDSLPIP
ncbi:lactate racemase domain-containing protein [Actinospongicola halichondriae]|uniref:lactate racemase domain-containing protein n=1 Tax=Actinospongicola halichondriae TaxID=3236844 RepID=UPI003D50C796